MVIDLETRLAGETNSRLSAEEGAAALRVEIETIKKVSASYCMNTFEQILLWPAACPHLDDDSELRVQPFCV